MRLIIDSSANVKNRYTYKPFGEFFTAETEEIIGNPFGFTGQWYDAEIGEYFLRARMYDPHINRFTGRDPIFGKFEQPLTLHKYLYCGNNPLNYTDLNGMWAFMIGGSLSGNICPGFIFETLTKEFGMMGYSMALTALAEAGVGGTAGAAFAFAHDPEQGFSKGWTYGMVEWVAGGLSASSGTGFAITADFALSTEAKRVSDLQGRFEEVGGSVTFGVPMWFAGIFNNFSAGYAFSRGVDERGSSTGINLHTISLGTGLAGWEAHAYTGYAWAQEWGGNYRY